MLLEDIVKEHTDRNNCLGHLGECYVKECIKHQLNKSGLQYSYVTRPMAYRIRYQYPKKFGIDIYLRMVDSDMGIHKAMIEVANWKVMVGGINDYIYNTRIVNKFRVWDKHNKCVHILCIQRRNIKYIADRCREDNIYIIPLREHYTPELIKHIREKDMISKEYIGELKKANEVLI
jgi:hypothetical protein